MNPPSTLAWRLRGYLLAATLLQALNQACCAHFEVQASVGTGLLISRRDELQARLAAVDACVALRR